MTRPALALILFGFAAAFMGGPASRMWGFISGCFLGAGTVVLFWPSADATGEKA